MKFRAYNMTKLLTGKHGNTLDTPCMIYLLKVKLPTAIKNILTFAIDWNVIA